MRSWLVAMLIALLPGISLSAATFAGGGPVSTNNDDTCDIGLFPAATLLLPYFEVDLAAAPGAGETTLFSITNVAAEEQVANVTLWTDLGYPVVSFNIYLTGYDVQSINLYDVLMNGRIAPPRGTGTSVSPEGDFSRSNDQLATTNCMSIPSTVSAEILTRMKQAFNLGRVQEGQQTCVRAGRPQQQLRAVGYATIDVVRTCRTLNPSDPAYYTEVIGFDNVLMGDWIQIERTRNFAEASPMVHIRAIPEGETPAVRNAFPEIYRSNFPRTFYGRFTGASKADGRQPLPSLFATRWIDGGAGGFDTTLTLWREPATGSGAECNAYSENYAAATEAVMFDEDENPRWTVFETGPVNPPIPYALEFPSTSRVDIRDERLPDIDDEMAGWTYLNLDDPLGAGAAQAWVSTVMRSEGRFSVGLDAIAMGNGCTPAMRESEISDGTRPLGPAGNVNP